MSGFRIPCSLPREDKDGVVSQNDFMIFMKDAGG